MTCYKLHSKLDKSCYMYFSSTPKTYEPGEFDFENAYNLKIHDNILPKVTHTKFLGVSIDDRLSWDHHIKALGQRGGGGGGGGGKRHFFQFSHM